MVTWPDFATEPRAGHWAGLINVADQPNDQSTDRAFRKVLIIGALYNVGGASLFAFPNSIGQLAGLPVPVAPVYSVLLSLFVLLFGAAYAWLALQPTIDRPMVGFAAIGKASVFVGAIVLWAMGQASAWLIPGATGDLIFAAIFAWWLRASRTR
jgi:hypothetical protein